jgi:hypothetical protein
MPHRLSRIVELAQQQSHWLAVVALLLLTPLVPRDLEPVVALGLVPLVGLFLLVQVLRRPLAESVLGASALLGAAAYAMSLQMGGSTQFVILLLALALPLLALAALGAALWRWRRLGKAAFVPLGAALAGFLLVIGCLLLGRWTCDALFWWNLPRYREVVERVRSGGIAVTDKIERLDDPVARSPRCHAVFASREPGGAVIVEFWVGGGFPVKHAGYMYYSRDEIEPESELRRRWPGRRKMAPNWYEIRD